MAKRSLPSVVRCRIQANRMMQEQYFGVTFSTGATYLQDKARVGNGYSMQFLLHFSYGEYFASLSHHPRVHWRYQTVLKYREYGPISSASILPQSCLASKTETGRPPSGILHRVMHTYTKSILVF